MLFAIFDILYYREAWKALGDSSPSQAMQEYIAAVKKLDPGWNPQVRLNDYT
jgi:acyl-CoA-binding protein